MCRNRALLHTLFPQRKQTDEVPCPGLPWPRAPPLNFPGPREGLFFCVALPALIKTPVKKRPVKYHEWSSEHVVTPARYGEAVGSAGMLRCIAKHNSVLSCAVRQRPFSSPSFLSIGVPPGMVDALARIGASSPTEIQRSAIPEAVDPPTTPSTAVVSQMLFAEVLSGESVLLESQTGSGKTLAYLVPSIVKV